MMKEKFTEKEKKKMDSVQEEKEVDEAVIISAPDEPVPVENMEEKIDDSIKFKTRLGREILDGRIKDISDVLSRGVRIREAEIVDFLLPELESDLLLVGQAKGKFGGGQRRIFKQTQKKTKEGNKLKFATCAVVGDKKGHVGLGFGKSKETIPARDKSLRNAKMNMISIVRGCGNWSCGCREDHSIPFKVEGKCGSIRVQLIPAPKGKGLIAEEECKKMFRLAGIGDLFVKSKGHTATKINMIYACFDALKNLTSMKYKPHHIEVLGIGSEER